MHLDPSIVDAAKTVAVAAFAFLGARARGANWKGAFDWLVARVERIEQFLKLPPLGGK